MSTGVLICRLCEWAGRPAGSRFTVLADEIGQALMAEHVLEPHLALSVAATVPDIRPIDVALGGGEGGN